MVTRNTDEMLKKNVINYLGDKINNHAILIDGGWGSGKTHFIKNHLIPHIEELESSKTESDRKKIIYTSAYGIKDTDEITQLILAQIVGKIGKIATPMLKFIGNISSEKAGIDVGEKITDKVLDLAEFVLIIDDLERENCGINALLGYINTFVEHNDIKVILVANEKEIGKSRSNENQELKYLVAQSDKIKFPIVKQPDESLESDTALTLDKLDERVGLLFNRHSDYKRIKEKLIGQTFAYRPDFEAIALDLIEEHSTNEKLKKFLVELLSKFSTYNVKAGDENIRTFKFFLSKITEVSFLFSDFDRMTDKQLKEMTECYYKVCIIYKKGIFDVTPTERYGYVELPIFDTRWTQTYYFTFIGNHINLSQVCEKEIAESINSFLDEQEANANDPENPHNILKNDWRYMDDNEILKVLKELQNRLTHDKFGNHLYSEIIGTICQLVGIGFDEEILSNVTNLMVANLKPKREKFRRGGFSYLRTDDEKVKELYEKYLARLEKESMPELITAQTVLTIFDSDDWAKNLQEMASNLQPNRLVGYYPDEIVTEFLKGLDITGLLTKLDTCNAIESLLFCQTIHIVYDSSDGTTVFQNDTKELKKIYAKIEEIINDDSGGIVKKDNLRIVNQFLEKKNLFDDVDFEEK